MKILISVISKELGTLELQAERNSRSQDAPIGLVLPGSQIWLTVEDAIALRGLLRQGIGWARVSEKKRLGER